MNVYVFIHTHSSSLRRMPCMHASMNESIYMYMYVGLHLYVHVDLSSCTLLWGAGVAETHIFRGHYEYNN